MAFQKYDVKEKKKEKKERKNEQRKTNKVAKIITLLTDFKTLTSIEPHRIGSYLKQKGQNDNIHERKELNVVV